MFKSMRELKKQSDEISKNWDPAQQMKDGMASMQQATETMAQQTKAAALAADGLPAKASVVSVAQTGQMVNFQPTMQIELNVFSDGGPPYPVTVTQVVEQQFLSLAAPGRQLMVKVDPSDHEVVWIDWAGSSAL